MPKRLVLAGSLAAILFTLVICWIGFRARSGDREPFEQSLRIGMTFREVLELTGNRKPYAECVKDLRATNYMFTLGHLSRLSLLPENVYVIAFDEKLRLISVAVKRRSLISEDRVRLR